MSPVKSSVCGVKREFAMEQMRLCSAACGLCRSASGICNAAGGESSWRGLLQNTTTACGKPDFLIALRKRSSTVGGPGVGYERSHTEETRERLKKGPVLWVLALWFYKRIQFSLLFEVVSLFSCTIKLRADNWLHGK